MVVRLRHEDSSCRRASPVRDSKASGTRRAGCWAYQSTKGLRMSTRRGSYQSRADSEEYESAPVLYRPFDVRLQSMLPRSRCVRR